MFRALAGARTWRETAYLLLDLPVGIAGFTLVVTGLSLGASLLITFVGVPIVALTLLACRFGAAGELRRARLIGLELDPPPSLAADGTFLRRIVRQLKDVGAWRAALYFLLMLPVGV